MYSKFYLHILYVFVVGFVSNNVAAQTAADAIMMQKGQICIAAMATQSQWDYYWEGDRLRNNDNLGTVRTRSAQVMAAVGVTKKINILAGLPWVQTNASKGFLAGQSGLQDASLWVKWEAVRLQAGPGELTVFGLAGGSIPASNYVPDFLPMSIGLGSKNGTVRALVDYRLDKGFFLSLRGSHTWRSNITIDRDVYLNGSQYIYSNEVALPNMIDAAAQIGWRHYAWIINGGIEHIAGLSGDDIRRNDMPFPTNKMTATALNFNIKYQPKTWGGTIGFQQVYAGRNMGRSTTFNVGLLYAFQAWNKSSK